MAATCLRLRRTAGAQLGVGEVVAVPAPDFHLAARLDAAADLGAETERLLRTPPGEGERLRRWRAGRDPHAAARARR